MSFLLRTRQPAALLNVWMFHLYLMILEMPSRLLTGTSPGEVGIRSGPHTAPPLLHSLPKRWEEVSLLLRTRQPVTINRNYWPGSSWSLGHSSVPSCPPCSSARGPPCPIAPRDWRESMKELSGRRWISSWEHVNLLPLTGFIDLVLSIRPPV